MHDNRPEIPATSGQIIALPPAASLQLQANQITVITPSTSPIPPPNAAPSTMGPARKTREKRKRKFNRLTNEIATSTTHIQELEAQVTQQQGIIHDQSYIISQQNEKISELNEEIATLRQQRSLQYNNNHSNNRNNIAPRDRSY